MLVKLLCKPMKAMAWGGTQYGKSCQKRPRAEERAIFEESAMLWFENRCLSNFCAFEAIPENLVHVLVHTWVINHRTE
jgi:hypothetical protein